jgi:hypothetical protein
MGGLAEIASREGPSPMTDVYTEPPIVCYAFSKNSREEVVAALTEYKGHKLAELRCYVRPEKTQEGERIRTPKGLTVNRAHLYELRDAVVALIEEEERQQAAGSAGIGSPGGRPAGMAVESDQ